MEDNSGRPSNDVLIEDAGQVDTKDETSTKNDKQKKIIIFSIIAAVVLVVLILLIFFVFVKTDSEEDNNKEPFNPIPEKEDLDFTEEAHRLFSREVATQTMVLATNNDALPLRNTDQVVLFGAGTENTIYGGWGSGEVYNKGTWDNLTPIKVLEGIENKKDKFIYIKNDIGYEINTTNLTDADVQAFSVKRENAQRTVAILTISRRSGEGSDRPQDKSNVGTLLSDAEIETYNSLVKYFDKIVLVLNVGSVIELNGIEKESKVSILISYLPGMEAGNAIADILVGDANPSGHLTDTWASTIADYPTTNTFTESIQYVRYKEGLFVGYRYFEDDATTQSKVVFPFGHGLSYTTFEVKNECKYNDDKKIFEIKSFIQNTGDRAGKHVIQVYVKTTK